MPGNQILIYVSQAQHNCRTIETTRRHNLARIFANSKLIGLFFWLITSVLGLSLANASRQIARAKTHGRLETESSDIIYRLIPFERQRVIIIL